MASKQDNIQMGAEMDATQVMNTMSRLTASMKTMVTYSDRITGAMSNMMGTTGSAYGKLNTELGIVSNSQKKSTAEIDKSIIAYQRQANAQQAMGRNIQNMSNAFNTVSKGANNLYTNISRTINPLNNMAIVAGTTAVAMNQLANGIESSVKSAVSRLDTLATAPKIWQALGASTEESTKALSDLNNEFDGLPVSIDDASGSLTKMYSALKVFRDPAKKSLGYAEDVTEAFINMGMASGSNAERVNNSLIQLAQAMAKGTGVGQEFKTLLDVMPAQLGQLAEEVLGAGHSGQELAEALGDGVITMEDMTDAMIKLGGTGGKWAEQALLQSRTATNGWSYMKIQFTKLVAEILTGTSDVEKQGEAWTPYINKIYDLANSVKAAGPSIIKFVDGFKIGLQNTHASLGPLQPLLTAFTDWIKNTNPEELGFRVERMAEQLLKLLVSLKAASVGFGILGSVTGNIKSVGDALGIFGGKSTATLKELRLIRQEMTTVGSVVQGTQTSMEGASGAMKALGLATETSTTQVSAGTTAFTGLAGAIGAEGTGAVGSTGLFSGALSALLSPIGLVVAAIALIVGAITAWVLMTDKGKETWQGFVEMMEPLINHLKETFTNLWNAVSDLFTQIGDTIVTILNDIGFNFEDFGSVVDVVMSAISAVVGIVVSAIVVAFDLVINTITLIINIITFLLSIFTNVFHGISGVVDVVVGLLTGNFDKVKQGLGKIGEAADGFKKAFKKVWNDLKSWFKGIFDTFTGWFKGIGDWIGGIIDGFNDVDSKSKSTSKKSYGSSKKSFGAIRSITKTDVNAVRQFNLGNQERALQVDLSMGNSTYRGFAEDVSGAQGSSMRLRKSL
jgi:tape measure domain-containing protein